MTRAPGAVLRVVAALRRADGAPCPSNSDLAEALGITEGSVWDLLDGARRLGLIRVDYLASNRRVISAPDGNWCTGPTDVRRRDGGIRRAAPAAVPPRRCLACRQPFQPAHRHNFLCCAAAA